MKTLYGLLLIWYYYYYNYFFTKMCSLFLSIQQLIPNSKNCIRVSIQLQQIFF